ncbi:MAG: Gfo/Idh/MocA family protein [Gammaproteobacteria bacterium]
MKRVFNPLPETSTRSLPTQTVGVIGCGNFAYSNIAYYLTTRRGRVIKGCMDTNVHRAASLCLDFGASYYTDDADAILDDPDIRLVYIASNHASHAEYAVRALARGKSVHIEKPHVVSHDQLRRLCRAMQGTSSKVGLGFNRPLSRFGRELARLLAQENSPFLMNWFVAGHEIPSDHWYLREEEGGRILGNLCHWTDFMMRMIPRERHYPVPGRADASTAVRLQHRHDLHVRQWQHRRDQFLGAGAYVRGGTRANVPPLRRPARPAG